MTEVTDRFDRSADIVYHMDTLMTDLPARRPIKWERLRADEAERLIRERSADTAKVIIVGHPKDRSKKREILTVDIYPILRAGLVSEAPTRIEGGWEAVIRRRIRGTRDAGGRPSF